MTDDVQVFALVPDEEDVVIGAVDDLDLVVLLVDDEEGVYA